jgi:hypothetical protein
MLRTRAGQGSGHFAHAPGLDLVHEPPHAFLALDERALEHKPDRLAHIVLEVGEGTRRPRRLRTGGANSSSVNVCMPHRVWCRNTISSVPRWCWDIASERITSSVTTPPALRITCASPSANPRTRAGSTRVHAGNDRNSQLGRGRQFRECEPTGVRRIVGQQLIGGAHEA